MSYGKNEGQSLMERAEQMGILDVVMLTEVAKRMLVLLPGHEIKNRKERRWYIKQVFKAMTTERKNAQKPKKVEKPVVTEVKDVPLVDAQDGVE